MKLLVLIFIACVFGASTRAEQKLPDSLGLGAPRMPGAGAPPAEVAPVQPVAPMGQEAVAATAPAQAPATVAAAPADAAAAPTAAANAAAPIPETDEAKAAQAKVAGTESIRKLISEQPDPSLVLEPPTEQEAAKAAAIEKAASAPKPPARPVASIASPLAPMAIGNDPGGQNAAKQGNRLRVGRIPGEIPLVPEVSIILVDNAFYPARIRLKEGVQARLFFTTTNDKPAAIIVEQMQIQRWVAKEKEKHISAVEAEKEKIRFEATREVTSNKVTEILLEPRRGSYSFIDVISGAKGQLTVE